MSSGHDLGRAPAAHAGFGAAGDGGAGRADRAGGRRSGRRHGVPDAPVRPAGILNVGAGRDIRIRDLAGLVAAAVGFEGEIAWDTGKPDGAQRKLLDVDRLERLGWRPRREMRHGIRETYAWYLESVPDRA